MVNKLSINDKDFWKQKNVFITGHTGFKGSWLTVCLLHLGVNVWGLSLPLSDQNLLFKQLNLLDNASRNFEGKFTHLEGDINDLNLINTLVRDINPDIVFHLAAETIVRKSYFFPIKTWQTNVMGTLSLLEALKKVDNYCAVILITSDKVYENKNISYGYCEEDSLGGVDPYSSSKAAMELLVSSWRKSYCGLNKHQSNHLSIATVRAGNVIGGGDWAEDRLVPDMIKSLQRGEVIKIRNPDSTRAWFHVLEPLSGYLQLAKQMYLHHFNKTIKSESLYTQSFNFGPDIYSNKKVRDLVESILALWPGEWDHVEDENAPEEAKLLHLSSDKAFEILNWRARWDFKQTVSYTVNWYMKNQSLDALTCCLNDLISYNNL